MCQIESMSHKPSYICRCERGENFNAPVRVILYLLSTKQPKKNRSHLRSHSVFHRVADRRHLMRTLLTSNLSHVGTLDALTSRGNAADWLNLRLSGTKPAPGCSFCSWNTSGTLFKRDGDWATGVSRGLEWVTSGLRPI